jgi:hypothetical protein
MPISRFWGYIEWLNKSNEEKNIPKSIKKAKSLDWGNEIEEL